MLFLLTWKVSGCFLDALCHVFFLSKHNEIGWSQGELGVSMKSDVQKNKYFVLCICTAKKKLTTAPLREEPADEFLRY